MYPVFSCFNNDGDNSIIMSVAFLPLQILLISIDLFVSVTYVLWELRYMYLVYRARWVI